MPTSPEPRLGRFNRLDTHAEAFRPPNFAAPQHTWARSKARLRRLLDPAANSLWQDLTKLLPHAKGTLLDVGCGNQPYRGLVPSGVAYRGLDRAAAKENFGYQAPDTVYFNGDRWPVQDATADWVLCTEVLEHVAQPAIFLAEARRCLKTDGWLLLTVPFSARWHYIPYDYWRYTPSGLALLLQTAGFVGVQVYSRGNSLTVACHKWMVLGFSLLLASGQGWRPWGKRLVGLAFSPLLAAAVLLAAATLDRDFGDDPIGFTVLAKAGTTNFEAT